MSKGSKVCKPIILLLGMILFTTLMTFGHFPRVENRQYHFHLMYNEGAVGSVSMFTRLMATPLLFQCKLIVKSLVYKGRTVIIKIRLVRHVMPKRELRSFLRRRQEGRSELARRLSGSLSSLTIVEEGSAGSQRAGRGARPSARSEPGISGD